MRTGILNSTNILLDNVSYAIYGLPVAPENAYSVVDINVCNRGYTDANIQIYLSNETDGEDFDIESGIAVTGSNVYLITGVALSAGDVIYVKSDQPNVSVSVYGAQFEYDDLAALPLPSIEPADSITGPSPLANDRFGETVYANNTFYLINSSQGVYLYSAVDDSLLTTFTNPGSANNGFGTSISATDFFVFISAPEETAAPVANGTGVVYVFSSISYALLTTLANLNTTQTIYGELGTCLESNADYLLIGDSGGGVTTDTGIILVYDSETRNPIGELTADSLLVSGDGLGTNVSLDGSFVVAGLPDANKIVTFSAASQSVGVEVTGPAGTTNFGYSVDTRAGIVVVGDPAAEVESITNAGRVFVYDSSGNFTVELESPIELAQGDRFGEAVGITPDYILVGAPGVDDPEVDTGKVFSYLYDGTFVATITI